MLNAQDVPQSPGDRLLGRRGNDTSERGRHRARRPRAINDDRGRIMVLMTFNTDFGDSYEREGENPLYFHKFSVPGYAFGINAIIYALTH